LAEVAIEYLVSDSIAMPALRAKSYEMKIPPAQVSNNTRATTLDTDCIYYISKSLKLLNFGVGIGFKWLVLGVGTSTGFNYITCKLLALILKEVNTRSGLGKLSNDLQRCSADRHVLISSRCKRLPGVLSRKPGSAQLEYSKCYQAIATDNRSHELGRPRGVRPGMVWSRLCAYVCTRISFAINLAGIRHN
jgi:hypothetical protein